VARPISGSKHSQDAAESMNSAAGDQEQAKSVSAAPRMADSAQEVGRRRKQLWWAGAALVVATLLAYAPVVRDEFIWDDDAYVTKNPTLRSLEGLRLMWFEPLSIPQYYPLVHTTFWVEYHLWGLHPLGYHVVNVLLHATSVLLLWRLLVRLRVPGAWLGAAIFALHPVTVESVAWVTERKNVLSLALTLSSMLAYLRFAPAESSDHEEQAAANPQRWYWYGLSLLLFVAALLSKTVVATMPAVMLVIIWWKRGRITWRDVGPLLPFFVVGAAMGWNTAQLERTHVGAEGEEWNFTPVERVLIAGRALWFYGTKLAFPYPLIFFYERWQIDQSVWWQYLYPAAAIALIVALFLLRQRIGRGPLAAVLIFAGVLAPALGFLNVYPFRYSFVADHFQYHASLGLITLAAAGLALGWNKLAGTARTAASVIIGAVLVTLGLLTFRQTMIYENLERLYRDTIAKNQTGVIAYSNLAAYLGSIGRNDEAVDLAREAVRIAPHEPGVHNNLGAILMDMCRRSNDHGPAFAECLRELEAALAVNPRFVAAHSNLAVAMIYADQPDAALQHIHTALEINPRDPRSLYGMASLLAALGKSDEAEGYYLQALARNPDHAEAHYGLGLIRSEQGKTDEALQHWSTAVALDPRYTDAHYALAGALAARGDVSAAAEHYRAAVELRPNYVAALVNLGIAEANLGKFDEAVRALQEALRLEPNNPEAHFGLGVALSQIKQPAAAAEHFAKILAIDPQRADVQFQLGNLFAGQDEMAKAVEHYAAAVKLQPNYVDALQNLGAAQLTLGNVDQAIEHFNEVLRLQPNNPQARANLEQALAKKRAGPEK